MGTHSFKWFFLIEVVATFSSLPQVTVNLGEKAELPCTNIKGNVVIQWIRLYPDQNITAVTYANGWDVNEHLPIREKIKIPGTLADTNYNLQILTASLSDAGIYQCTLADGEIAKSHDVQLLVKDRNMGQNSGFDLHSFIILIGVVSTSIMLMTVVSLVFYYKGQRRGNTNADTEVNNSFWGKVSNNALEPIVDGNGGTIEIPACNEQKPTKVSQHIPNESLQPANLQSWSNSDCVNGVCKIKDDVNNEKHIYHECGQPMVNLSSDNDKTYLSLSKYNNSKHVYH